jgi:ABC-type branched-subunit amino acid transport system ATPase component
VSLEVDDVVSGYGKMEILHGVSIRAAQGVVTCIIGPNGSGKSTLLRTIAGLIRARRGLIKFEFENITNLSPPTILKKGLALISQSRSVFPYLTLSENLKMGAYILKDKNIIKQRFKEVYDLFPILKERGQQRAHSLSGGEQRMLELGRAMMLRPKLLMLDEPSAMLSPKLIGTTFAKMKKICQLGIGILMVEQNVKAAFEIADSVYVLDQGENRFNGSTKEFLDTDKLVKLYLGVASTRPL